MDDNLRSAEQAVEMMGAYASDQLISYDRLARDYDYRKSYTDGLAKVFSEVALGVDSAFSYYIRYNVEIGEQEAGFLYSRRTMNQNFLKLRVPNLTGVDPDDLENGGWYYRPVQAGKSVWLSPYYDASLDHYTITYAAPMMKNGKLAAVIGMSIDFSSMMNDVADLTGVQYGYAALTSGDGEVYYHPTLQLGEQMKDHVVTNGGLDVILESQSSEGSLVQYRFDGVDKKMAFATLRNGMKLWFCADSADIDAGMYQLSRQILLAMAFVMAGFTAIALVGVSHIVRPLQRLIAAVHEVESGNLNAALPDAETNDEVGVLTAAYSKAVASMREHMNFVNSLAYKDGLTGVKNRTAYEAMLEELDKNGEQDYAVVMFDVNWLKNVNDCFGHEEGDELLITAVRRICKLYKHSPVYRIGGDEFTAILKGEDYRTRNELYQEFNAIQQRENAQEDKEYKQAWVAIGMATFDPKKDDNAEHVVKRADERMYENKEAFKQTHTPGWVK